jgi:hypothetical protein
MLGPVAPMSPHEADLLGPQVLVGITYLQPDGERAAQT